jgi:signal transduction histidine kinase
MPSKPKSRRRPPQPQSTPDATPVADPWRVAAALVTAPTLEAQLNLLLEEAPRIGDAGGVDTATVYLRDDATGNLRVAALYGYTPARSYGPRSSGLTQHVLDTGETLIIPDTSADPRVNPVVREAGIRSFVALPLTTLRGEAPETIGVLYVNARHPEAFAPARLAALKGLAAVAAVAIENTLLLEAQRAVSRRLEDVLQLREQFVSLASHELKGPLTPLKGYAQAIARRLDRAHATGTQIDEAWLRHALSVMVSQIDRLDQLVTDLLDVSRVRAGRFTISPEPLDAVALARETFERFQDAMAMELAAEPENARHTFRFLPEVETLPVVWDSTRIDQLLTNLLSNAVKYSPGGGAVELRVGLADAGDPALRRRAPAIRPGWVQLAVRDEGIGLAQDDAGASVVGQAGARIFDAFTRGENTGASEASGFGLGLFICAEIVRRHGGVIWAESPGPKQGSTFYVLLSPVATPTPELQ